MTWCEQRNKTALFTVLFASKPLQNIRELVFYEIIAFYNESYIATFSTKPVVNVLLDDVLVFGLLNDLDEGRLNVLTNSLQKDTKFEQT